MVVAESAEEAGIDPSVFAADEMTCAVAENELRSSERRAREHHVTGTPGWLMNDGQLIVGLRSRAFFITLGQALRSGRHQTHEASTGRPDR